VLRTVLENIMSKQPRDDANEPIPVLGLKPAGGSKINFNPSSSSLSTQFSASIRVITLYATDDCYVEIGNAAVQANTSTSHFVPSGFLYDIALGSQFISAETFKYISVIGATVSGVLHISERN
jgi:hypothetical protein